MWGHHGGSIQEAGIDFTPATAFDMIAKRTVVRTLICHQHVPVGLKCLGSLLRYSSEPLSLIVHDDGSLTEEDKDTLIAGLPGATIISREEADSRVLPLLSAYPQCLAYRRRHPLALKLIDMPLMSSGDLAYCDSDVLFLKPFKRLFVWPDEDCSAIFMQDIQDAYSLRPWHLYPLGSMRLPQRLNSGVLLFRTSEYDLEFVESFLGNASLSQVFEKRPHWIEQTCWAALAWRVGCRLWDGRQMAVANPKMEPVCAERVAIHFVAACRDRINEFPERPNGGVEYDEANAISSIPARLSSPLRVIAQDIARRF